MTDDIIISPYAAGSTMHGFINTINNTVYRDMSLCLSVNNTECFTDLFKFVVKNYAIYYEGNKNYCIQYY